jgi:integrase
MLVATELWASRGTLQDRALRAFKTAVIGNARDALVHGLRHTPTTELAQSDVSDYALMNLLGGKSMSTSQRYVAAAGSENRSAAAQNRMMRCFSGKAGR